MNDKTIISVISKTYFAIVSFFIFTFLLLFILFVTLQNGIFIESISTKQIQVKQLYIKWNEKLDISLKEIKLKSNHKKKNSNLDYKQISAYLNSISHTKKWFNSIIIENISINDINASFKYENKKNGFIFASSNELDLNASISSQSDIIQINIHRFSLKKYDINAKGKVYLDTKNTNIYTNLHLNIVKEASLTINSVIDTEKIQYKIKSTEKIKSIKKLIKLAHLPGAVNYWAYNAITKMSYVQLNDISGFINYNDINNTYKNIYVKAIVHDADYKYNPSLDAIHTKKIELEFTKGILNIRPIQAYSYGMFLNKSWLNIDFTKKEELLTLYLKFNAKLNRDVLKILKAYKIKLPFLQHTGEVKSNLILKIGLRNIGVSVKGDFYTKRANFDYLNLNVNIADAKIILNNYDVNIHNMKASYKNIANATVNVVYNAKKSKGNIDFKFSKISLNGLHLHNKNKTFHAKYNIHPKGDSVDIVNSQWEYKNKLIAVDKISIPFNIRDTNITIPATFISIGKITTAFISGKINISNFYSNLDIDILKFSYDGITSSQSNTPLKVLYDGRLRIDSKNPIYFNLSGSKYKAKNFSVEIEKNLMYLKHTSLEIGKYITTKIYAKYDLNKNKAHISLSDFILKDPNTQNILYKNKKILLSATVDNEIIKVNSLELNANFISKKNGWKLKVNSLNTLSDNSSFLEKLHINDGEFTLYKQYKDKYTRFKASIVYPYKIFVKNNTPLEKYTLNGKIYKSKVFIDINNNTKITIQDNVNIKLNDTIINLKELIRAIDEIQITNNSSDKSSLNILLSAHNSQLYYSKERSILYDSLEVQYYDTILSAQLQHDNGKAGLEFQNRKFHIHGKNFNDRFMNKLFSLSNFENGSLDFSINGNIDDYKGVIFIRKTTLKDYKALNNILAFINTVPSLVTFNVPGYSKNGIFVKNAYVNFQAKKNNFELKNIFLDSKEIDILGRGNVNLNKEDLDIMLNLKTDLGSELSKVPLVGYVILGKDTISTTLNIKGKIDNPQVKSLIAKDIIVAPLNIIKRTFLLPYELLKKK